MQYLNFFIRISRAIPHVKKSALINDWKNFFCLLGRILTKRGVGEQVRFVPNTVGESGNGPILAKFCKIYSHLILE